MIDYAITSLILLLIGVAFNIYHASKPHGKYGYRSKTALSSKERWEAAQSLSRRYFLGFGVLSLLISLSLFYLIPGNGARFFSAVMPIGMIFLVIAIIEKRLKKIGEPT